MKNHTWWLLGLSVALVVGVYLASHQTSPSTLKIGLISGTSGDYAVVGENYNKGAELAKDQWVQTHSGQGIDLIEENDGFDLKTGLSAYQKLASVDDVDAFLNMTTVTVDAAYNLIHASGKPFIQGFEQSEPAEKDNIFQVWPSGVPTETELGTYVQNKGYKNVVIIVADDIATWQNFANAFLKGYRGTTTTVYVNSSDTDMRTSVSKLLSYNPDAVVFYTVPQQQALIIKEIKAQSSTPPRFIFDQDIQTGEKDYETILGSLTALNGSVAMVNVNGADNSDFVSAFKTKYGTDPGIGASVGYDSFNVLMKAYDPNTPKWISNIQATNYEGASGDIMFDDLGLRTAHVVIDTIKNGALPQ